MGEKTEENERRNVKGRFWGERRQEAQMKKDKEEGKKEGER